MKPNYRPLRIHRETLLWLEHNHGTERTRRILIEALERGNRVINKFTDREYDSSVAAHMLLIPEPAFYKYKAKASLCGIALDKYLTWAVTIGLEARKRKTT